jgi:hypothetical protein
MALADVSCQALAVSRFGKLARAMVAGVVPFSCLLITITVTAPSEVRCAANTDTASGFGAAAAATLVSPNDDLPPS